MNLEIMRRIKDDYTNWNFVNATIDGEIKDKLFQLDDLCEGRGLITPQEKQFEFMYFLIDVMEFNKQQAFDIYTNTEMAYSNYYETYVRPFED